jgi:hypothetical protein
MGGHAPGVAGADTKRLSHARPDMPRCAVGQVGDRMEAEEPISTDYPFSGPMFLLTHRPLEPPDPGVMLLSGDIGEAVATALDAAGGKNLEILGADVASQCLQRRLVDEILVYVRPGLRFAGDPRRGWSVCRVAAAGQAQGNRVASGVVRP